MSTEVKFCLDRIVWLSWQACILTLVTRISDTWLEIWRSSRQHGGRDGTKLCMQSRFKRAILTSQLSVLIYWLKSRCWVFQSTTTVSRFSKTFSLWKLLITKRFETFLETVPQAVAVFSTTIAFHADVDLIMAMFANEL